MMWLRKMPSYVAPSLEIAAFECSLRLSVQSTTRIAPRSSNACLSMRCFIDGLIFVPRADLVIQVDPISKP